MDVFISSTLKSEWNKEFNPRLCEALEEKGFSVHLPQRDTDQTAELVEIAKENLQAVSDAKVILGVAENVSINWGLEVGFAAGTDQKVVLLVSEGTELPAMVLPMYTDVLRVKDLENIKSYIDDLSALL